MWVVQPTAQHAGVRCTGLIGWTDGQQPPAKAVKARLQHNTWSATISPHTAMHPQSVPFTAPTASGVNPSPSLPLLPSPASAHLPSRLCSSSLHSTTISPSPHFPPPHSSFKSACSPPPMIHFHQPSQASPSPPSSTHDLQPPGPPA